MSTSSALEDQSWMKVLLAFYEQQITVEVTGPNISVELHSNILEDSDMDEDRVVSEIEYLVENDLITWVDIQGVPPDFKQYRLTKEGLQVVQEHKQAERQQEWREQSLVFEKMLAIATAVLATSAIVEIVQFYISIS